MSQIISNKERNEIKLSIKNSINKNEINDEKLKQFIEEKVEIELRNRLNVKKMKNFQYKKKFSIKKFKYLMIILIHIINQNKINIKLNKLNKIK